MKPAIGNFELTNYCLQNSPNIQNFKVGAYPKTQEIMDCEILTTGDKLWFGADHFHAMSLKVADYSHILGTEKKTNDFNS